jgi:hypothetical protein
MMKMVAGVPPCEYWFSKKKIFRVIGRVAGMVVGLQLTKNDMEAAKTYEDKFKAMFMKTKVLRIFPNPLAKLVPLPEHVVKNWDDDKEFAWQFLNGVNPMMIEVVKDVKKQLTKELIDYFGKD